MSKSTPDRANRYLWFRPETDIIWFRMAVPKRYKEQAGKPLIQEPLGTTDRRDARLLAGARRAELFEQWGALPAHHVPTEHELEEIAVRFGHDGILEYEDRRRENVEFGNMGAWRRHARRTQINTETQAFMSATRNDALVRGLADAAIEELNLDLPEGSEGYAKLCELLNRARLPALDVAERRALGEIDAETDNKFIVGVRERQARSAKSGERLLDLFDAYSAELLAAKRKRPAGVKQDRMVIAQFAEFVGEKKAATAIGYDQAKAYVDALDTIPSNYSKQKAYRGLTVHQAIEKGMKDGVPLLSLITKQRYISTLSPFFDWLRSEKGGRRIKVNPFSGLHKDISKAKKANARPPFTAAQITKIINSPLFTGFLADGKEHLPGNQHSDDWRKWIPLICLFSGARIGEIAQLHVDDIVKIEGTWCAELRHDEAAGLRTKSDKTRIVALHSTLIRIGVLDFVQRQKQRAEHDGNRQLFLELECGDREQFGDMPSKWWRRYLGKIGVKPREGKDGFGSHSFRHTIADQLRAAGHLDQVFGPLIMGHSTSSVTGGYGQSRQGTPRLSASLIESVKFVPIERGRIVEGGEPVDFSHLYARKRRES